MKLDVIKRDIIDITVTDHAIQIALELGVSHGRAKKTVTPITVEHTVDIAALFPGDIGSGIDDAIAMAVAGVNKRADDAIAALKGLTSL